jgi:thymidylate kinase
VERTDFDSTLATPARTWLTRLFELLEGQQVNYVALRVDETVLPSGDELDLLVHPASFDPLLDQIRALCLETDDLHVVFWRVRPRLAATVLLTRPGSTGSDDRCWLDIRTGLHKGGRVLYDGSQLRRGWTLWDEDLGVRRLDDDRECALLLLRNASDGRTLHARHERILRRRRSPALPEVVRELGYDPAALEEGRVVPLRGVLRTRMLRYSLRSVAGRLRTRASGLNVVLYGPDGVGKSSQAQLLADHWRSLGVRASGVQTYHAFVPTASLTRHAARRTTSLKTSAYRRARPRGPRAVLVGLSYLKRLLLVVSRLHPQLREGKIMIHDRYLLDVFLKAQKEHGDRVRSLEKVLSALTPAGDLLFVLRAEPEVVSARTGELSPAEVAAAYELLDDCLATSRSTPVDVDANLALEHVQETLVRHLLRTLTDRFLTSR